jgi:hypothetical protein
LRADRERFKERPASSATQENTSKRIGRLGEAPGELKCTNGVAIRGDTLYVVEIGNTRLQSLSLPNREWLSTIGTYGRPDDGAGCLRAPCDVADSKSGR